MQDDDLISHFIKNNLLKPIVDAFVANGNRYNLLNSAVLDLFEYIRKVFIFLIAHLGSLVIPVEHPLNGFVFHAGKSEIFG